MRKRWATVMAVGLPLACLAMTWHWEGSFLPSPTAAVNMAIRATVLLVLGLMTWRCRAALDEVKLLKRILPVCMHCRKIRDENDRSCSLETYLSRHAGIKLSHGLCPDCASQFYPDTFPPERDSA